MNKSLDKKGLPSGEQKKGRALRTTKEGQDGGKLQQNRKVTEQIKKQFATPAPAPPGVGETKTSILRTEEKVDAGDISL
jgi:hypothetical protein